MITPRQIRSFMNALTAVFVAVFVCGFQPGCHTQKAAEPKKRPAQRVLVTEKASTATPKSQSKSSRLETSAEQGESQPVPRAKEASTTAQTPTADSLKSVFIAWQKDLLAEDPDTREKAISAMLPDAKDMAVLFPDHQEKLVRLFKSTGRFEKVRARKKKANNLQKERKRFQSAKKFEAVNQRDNDEFKRYQEVLKIIPANIPVYTVAVHYEKGSYTWSAFLFVNGRWIWFKNFKKMPLLIPRLTDEYLRQMEESLEKDLKKYGVYQNGSAASFLAFLA